MSWRNEVNLQPFFHADTEILTSARYWVILSSCLSSSPVVRRLLHFGRHSCQCTVSSHGQLLSFITLLTSSSHFTSGRACPQLPPVDQVIIHLVHLLSSMHATFPYRFSIFFLNNQPDAIIIPMLFCYKTLHISGIFSAHHQEFSTVHSAVPTHSHQR
jgi:hypothetical protein